MMMRIGRVAAITVLAIAAAGLGAGSAWAQKAALVQNTDEPGRNPYQQSITFSQDSTNCTQFVCTVTFPPISAGKRLVVTYASAYYSLAAGGQEQNVAIGADSNLFSNFQYLPAPTVVSSTFNRVAVGSPITYYVEAGHSPSLFLGGNTVSVGSLTGEATISGYLISAP